MGVRIISIGRKLLRAGPRRQLLLIEAFAGVLIAMVALHVFSFARVSRRWGPMVKYPPAGDAACADAAQAAAAVGWAVRAVARPLGATCLRQGMAARSMLARRGVGSLLHFGVCRDEDNRLIAHAWVDVGGVPVTGYPLAAAWVELGCFMTPAGRSGNPRPVEVSSTVKSSRG